MLTVGNYKTKDGRDVKIVAIECGIAIGYIVKQGVNGGLSTWRADNGRFYLDCDDDHLYDIIDTKPRIKWEAWLTIYNQGVYGVVVGGGYSTKNAAQENREAECIAIAHVVIDCVEGENLD